MCHCTLHRLCGDTGRRTWDFCITFLLGSFLFDARPSTDVQCVQYGQVCTANNFHVPHLHGARTRFAFRQMRIITPMATAIELCHAYGDACCATRFTITPMPLKPLVPCAIMLPGSICPYLSMPLMPSGKGRCGICLVAFL